MNSWRSRFRAVGVHFGLSVLVAALAATLVFAIWYPYPYREASGGRELFFLVMGVDVILGPLITLIIFNTKKSRQELRRDLAIVVLIQVAALGYGLWTVFIARPVHLVFEIDRFRVVHAIEVDQKLLPKNLAGLEVMPLSGPTLVSVRPFNSEQESFDVTVSALQGVQIGARPELWQSYSAGRPDVLRVARPVSQLKARFPDRVAEIDAVLDGVRRNSQTTVYLPMIGRKGFWTVFVDPVTADVLAFLPLDSF